MRARRASAILFQSSLSRWGDSNLLAMASIVGQALGFNPLYRGGGIRIMGIWFVIGLVIMVSILSIEVGGFECAGLSWSDQMY